MERLGQLAQVLAVVMLRTCLCQLLPLLSLLLMLQKAVEVAVGASSGSRSDELLCCALSCSHSDAVGAVAVVAVEALPDSLCPPASAGACSAVPASPAPAMRTHTDTGSV